MLRAVFVEEQRRNNVNVSKGDHLEYYCPNGKSHWPILQYTPIKPICVAVWRKGP